jgi:hypothetical protein
MRYFGYNGSSHLDNLFTLIIYCLITASLFKFDEKILVHRWSCAALNYFVILLEDWVSYNNAEHAVLTVSH